MVFSYMAYSQSGNFVSNSSCSVPQGWTSCTSSCWFSDCCVVWNPNVSEGGCGCWFGVARCQTSAIGQSFQITNSSSNDAVVKFSFERFNELLSFLNAKGVATNTIAVNLADFQANYAAQQGKVSVQTADYITFQNRYAAFIDQLSMQQKNLIAAFIADKEKGPKTQ